MSTECCSSSPRLDYNQFLEDITWLNEDYPEANLALLDGIRNGMTGYGIDNIIENQLAKRLNSETKLAGCDLPPSSSSIEDLNLSQRKSEKMEHNFETMEQVLQETATLSPLPRTASTSPNGHLKRNSALTVRPKSIGEERKAWLMEARRACCFNELQNNRFLNSASEIFYRNSVAHSVQQLLSGNFFNESTSVSCPDLEISRREHVKQLECEDTSGRRPKEVQDHEISTGSIDEKDSCEFLFQHVEGCFKPSKIRLSPRIEKLDKLIPKTSKEFLNTMRIVNTISPQPSEEQLNSLQSMHSVEESLKIDSSKSETNQQTEDSDEMEEPHVESEHHPCSDADTSGNRLAGMVCRSYKEVCIYGPHSSSGANSSSLPSEQTTEKTANETPRANISQSATGFPSLPKLVKSGSGVGGDETQKSAPPLYSSILQRSPTCMHGCGEANCVDSHQYTILHQAAKAKGKTSPSSQSCSPPLPLGSFDCGFCRTNNEPESVYRSHPLRVNDIVMCPSLRKYVCCFCGATGDKAHTIKYCPKNPIGFFAKKTRNSPVAPMMTVEKSTKGLTTSTEQTVQPIQTSPVKGKEKEVKNVAVSKESVTQSEQEIKSDSEIVAIVEESSEPVKRSSGNWIEAKTKGRKKKTGKITIELKH